MTETNEPREMIKMNDSNVSFIVKQITNYHHYEEYKHIAKYLIYIKR